jgi:hypothetical protein
MVLVSCPWCDVEQPVDVELLVAEFHCESCGTTAELVDATETAELAAAA